MKRWLNAYASWLERGSGWVLVTVLLLTAFFLWQLPQLNVRNDLQTFYPDDALTRSYAHIAATFGGDRFPQTLFVRFSPRAGSLTSPQAVQEMEQVITALERVPGVQSARGLPDLVKLISSGLHGGDPAFAVLPIEGDPLGYSFAQVIQLATQRLSATRDYLSGQNTALVLARIDPEANLLSVSRAAESALEPVAASARATHIRWMGYGSALRQFNAITARDVRTLLPLTAALMALVLLLSFRLPFGAWLTLAALVATLNAWSLAGAVTLWHAGAVSLALGLGLAALWRGMWLPGRNAKIAVAALGLAVLALGAGVAWTYGLGLLALALVACSFRQLREVYLPLLVVGVAAVWTFGLMALSGVSLSFLMVAVLPLLLGVGLDDSLHLLHRYRQALNRVGQRQLALQQALVNTGGALWLTTLTTVAGFAALLIAPSPPVRAFGLLAMAAMVCAFVVTLTLVPALEQRFTGAAAGRVARLVPNGWERLARHLIRPRWAKVWLSAVALLAVVAAFNGQQLKVYPYDLRWMLPAKSEAVRLYGQINAEFKNYDQVQLLLQGDVARLEVMRTLNQVVAPALAASPYARGVRHIGRLLDDVRYADPEAEARFSRDFQASPNAAYRHLLDRAHLQPAVRQRFEGLVQRDDAGRYVATVVRVDVVRAHTPEQVAAITADLRRRVQTVRPDLEALGITLSLTGSPFLEALSLTALKRGFFNSMALAFALVGAVLALAFRSWLWGAVCLVPMGLVMAFELATIRLLGLRISASTALVASLSIGLGVDYTIHLTTRVRESGNIALGFGQVLPTLLSASGTSLAAFLVLVLGQIPWNRDFGVLAATAIVFALGVSAFVYPALLALLRPWLGLRGGRPNGA